MEVADDRCAHNGLLMPAADGYDDGFSLIVCFVGFSSG